MKTLFTILLPVVTTITAIATHKSFLQGEYLLSALFTEICFLSASLWIATIASRKMAVR